jgi:hypothetical protein
MAAVVAGLAIAPAISAIEPCVPDKGPQVNQNTNHCFPTPAQCATGEYLGVYDGGTPGRGSTCIAAGGHIVEYTGGNANALCGYIIVADTQLTQAGPENPNDCP